MGLFDKIFLPKNHSANVAVKSYFSTFDTYRPAFHSYSGSIYEMDATRSAIHAIATHCSKLKPSVQGYNHRRIEKILQVRPNPWMTTSQFLYRLATILEVENTAFIVPILDKTGEITGFYPVHPNNCEIVESTNGIAFLRFDFGRGQKSAMEWERCGVMTKMQFKSDVFGESNGALYPTMSLMSMTNQGIIESIKQSATPRFLARLGNSIRDEDLAKEQTRFKNLNLTAENTNGVMIIDSKYADVKQIDPKPYVVDADQMKVINDNVYNYFGVNEKILRNEWDEASWNAFYEGKVEPFAIQLSMVLTSMLFTDREIAFGNEVVISANRLQFATTSNKLSVITQLFDRGLISFNEGREILQMPPIEGGDEYMIRGEYVNRNDKKADDEPNQDVEPIPVAEMDEQPLEEITPDASEEEQEVNERSNEEVIERRSKMPVCKDREYRNLNSFEIRKAEEGNEKECRVKGYASTFEPYVMFNDGEYDYSEKIEPRAFDEADMSDVIMQYDHEGRVYARKSNGTLDLGTDEHGLWIDADLSKTEGSKALYEDIRSGMITQMSFAFTVAEDHYDKETRTRVIDKIKKVYDVSAVSIPANPTTEISARSYFDGVIEEERKEFAKAEAREKQKQKIRILTEVF